MRWFLVWLLALYALLDFVAQYTITFRLFRDRVKLSPDQIHLLRFTIGISPEASGLDLVSKLVRSGLILGLLNGHRALAALRTAEPGGRQGDPAGTPLSEAEAAALDLEEDLDNEAGWVGLIKRGAILMGGQLLAVALFLDAVRLPSLMHLVLLAMLALMAVLRTPLYRHFGGPGGGARMAAGLFQGLLYLYAGALLWLEYAFQMEALQGTLQSHPTALIWLLGVRQFCPSDRGCAERALRTKVLLLLAARLAVKAHRWEGSLPLDVRRCAGFGQPCPLFYPRPQLHWEGLSPLLAPVLGMLQQAGVYRGNWASRTSLRAVKSEAAISSRGEVPGSPASESALPSEDEERTAPPPPLASVFTPAAAESLGEMTSTDLAKWLVEALQRASVGVSIRRRLEDPWGLIGLHFGGLMLLLAAYQSLSLLSLLLVLGLVALALLQERHRRAAWRWYLQPMTCACLLYQYLVYLGLPDGGSVFAAIRQMVLDRGRSAGYSQQLGRWLAAEVTHPPLLWLLFFSFAAASIQLVHDNRLAFEEIHRAIDPEGRLEEPGVPSGCSTLDQLVEAAYEGRPAPPRWLMLAFRSVYQDPSGLVWGRLRVRTRRLWTPLDHARFYAARHTSDVVLILVFVLSLINTDALHGIYLLWALVSRLPATCPRRPS